MRLFIIAAAALAVAGPSFAAPFEPGVYLGATAGRASVSSKYADNSSDISIGGDFSYLTKSEVSLYSFSARFNF